MLSQVLTAIDQRREASLEGLKEFLRIPSISARPEYKEEVARCARWLGDRLAEVGLSVEVAPTAGHPIVLARNEHKPGRPTVLVYGHYDVQPPEPLELWTTPPFEPSIRNDESGHPAVFARGAADDKGQVWIHLEAIRAWQAHGGVPVNLIVLIEGEEESGSENLEAFVRQRAAELKADIAVISDTAQFARGVPAITYSLRGLVYLEVFLTGPSRDLHSGLYGGSVPNPAHVLSRMLASLHDDNGRVAVEGFYDDVVELTEAEREMWRRLPYDDQAAMGEIGLSAGSGEPGYTSLERQWGRPACDVNGITGGYQGAGAKTIIPSTASAKLSCRLVPKQDPQKIEAAVRKHLADRCPPNVKMEIIMHGHSSPGVLVPTDGPAIQLAQEALRAGFGVEPTLIRSGGSIPVVGLVKNALGIDTLLVGFGLPDDRIHSPNEKFDLDALHKGTRTIAALFERLAHLR